MAETENEFIKIHKENQSTSILAWRIIWLEVFMFTLKYTIGIIFITNGITRNLTYGFFIGLFINLFLVTCIFISWAYHYYIFTEDDISINSGFLFHKTRTFDLRSIKSIRVRQNLMGKIFNYGTIELEIPGLRRMPVLNFLPDCFEWGKILETERLKHEKERSDEIIPAIEATPPPHKWSKN